MLIVLREKQCTALPEKGHDLGVCGKDLFARPMLDLGGKSARRIDRGIDIKAVFFGDGKIVGAVAGSSVDAARTRFPGGLVFKAHI